MGVVKIKEIIEDGYSVTVKYSIFETLVSTISEKAGSRGELVPLARERLTSSIKTSTIVLDKKTANGTESILAAIAKQEGIRK